MAKSMGLCGFPSLCGTNLIQIKNNTQYGVHDSCGWERQSLLCYCWMEDPIPVPEVFYLDFFVVVVVCFLNKFVEKRGTSSLVLSLWLRCV